MCVEIDENEKKEKLDTRRTKEGWDTRKLYEIKLLEDIPGISLRPLRYSVQCHLLSNAI